MIPLDSTLTMIEIGALGFGLFCLYQAMRLRNRVVRIHEQRQESITLRAFDAVKEAKLELCIIGLGYVIMAASLRLFGDHSVSQQLFYIIFGVVMLLVHVGGVLWVFGKGSFTAYAHKIYTENVSKDTA